MNNAPLSETRQPAKPPGQTASSRNSFFREFGFSLLAAVIGLGLILPFLWMVLTSLKSLPEVDAPNWFPAHFQWKNYMEVLTRIPYARFYANSLVVAGWVTFLQVLTSAFAAFSFSRLQWPGRDRLFLAYLATMMLPGLVMMVPNFQIMIKLHLIDTLAGLILPAAFSAFGTFLLRQFMLSIPASLDEAAEIDGASKWQLFWNIILPLTRPGLVTLSIFTFLGNYNSFFWPIVMLRSVDNYTLPVGLLYFDSVSSNTTHLLMAATTMSVLPMIGLFVMVQRTLVNGIQAGAVKG